MEETAKFSIILGGELYKLGLVVRFEFNYFNMTWNQKVFRKKSNAALDSD